MFSDLFSNISGKFGKKKELRFGQNFKELYSPKIQLDLSYIFSHRLFLCLHPKVFTKWHDFRLKQNKTKQKQNKTKKSGFSGGGGAHSPETPPVCVSKSFLNVKARSMPLYANKEAYT